MEEMEKEDTIRSMTTADLEKLSDFQLRICQQIQLQRANARAMDKVKEALQDKDDEIIGAMTMPPFVYTGPVMKIMAGCEVRFSSLMNDQIMDAHTQVDKFVVEESPNDIRVNQRLNCLLLAHSLVEFRGEEFGNVSLPDNYHELVRNSAEDARKVLEEIRDRRMEILGTMPVAVFQRLVEFYQAFQITVENVTKGDNVVEVLGN